MQYWGAWRMSQPLWIGCIWLMSVGPPAFRIQSKCNCNDDILSSCCKREAGGEFCGIAHHNQLCFYFNVMLLRFLPAIAITKWPKVGFHVKQVVTQITREVPLRAPRLLKYPCTKCPLVGEDPSPALLSQSLLLLFSPPWSRLRRQMSSALTWQVILCFLRQK